MFPFCFLLNFVIPVLELVSDLVPKFHTVFSSFGVKRPISSSEKSDVIDMGLDFGNLKNWYVVKRGCLRPHIYLRKSWMPIVRSGFYCSRVW